MEEASDFLSTRALLVLSAGRCLLIANNTCLHGAKEQKIQAVLVIQVDDYELCTRSCAVMLNN